MTAPTDHLSSWKIKLNLQLAVPIFPKTGCLFDKPICGLIPCNGQQWPSPSPRPPLYVGLVLRQHFARSIISRSICNLPPLFPAPNLVVGGFNGGGVFFLIFCLQFCLISAWLAGSGSGGVCGMERERGREGPEPCHPKPPVPRITPAAIRYQSQLAIKRQTFLSKHF